MGFIENCGKLLKKNEIDKINKKYIVFFNNLPHEKDGVTGDPATKRIHTDCWAFQTERFRSRLRVRQI